MTNLLKNIRRMVSGILENWNNGSNDKSQYSTIPVFHRSNLGLRNRFFNHRK